MIRPPTTHVGSYGCVIMPGYCGLASDAAKGTKTHHTKDFVPVPSQHGRASSREDDAFWSAHAVLRSSYLDSTAADRKVQHLERHVSDLDGAVETSYRNARRNRAQRALKVARKQRGSAEARHESAEAAMRSLQRHLDFGPSLPQDLTIPLFRESVRRAKAWPKCDVAPATSGHSEQWGRGDLLQCLHVLLEKSPRNRPKQPIVQCHRPASADSRANGGWYCKGHDARCRSGMRPLHRHIEDDVELTAETWCATMRHYPHLTLAECRQCRWAHHSTPN